MSKLSPLLDLLCLRLKATAAMHARVATEGPPEIRKYFADSAMLMMEAHDAILWGQPIGTKGSTNEPR